MIWCMRSFVPCSLSSDPSFYRKVWIDNINIYVTKNQFFLHKCPSFDKISRVFNCWSVYGALTILLIYNPKQLSYDYV